MTRKLLFIIIIAAARPERLLAQVDLARLNVSVTVGSAQSLEISSTHSTAPVSDRVDNQRNVRLGNVRQIKIFSSSSFVLKVSARDGFSELAGPEIPASAVFVSSGASAGTSDTAAFVFEKDVNLAINTPKPLIHSQAAGALNTYFNIEYYASGIDNADLRDGYLDGMVVYTIEVE